MLSINKTIFLILLGTIFIYSFQIISHPTYFPKSNYDFNQNPLDSHKIELGRKLFYDPILSGNNMISCASCHSPFASFAHNDHDLSHGIYDSIGRRNAPALFNLAWHNKLMWDGAINHIEMQALAPIHSQTEMGSSIQEVIRKLQMSKQYLSIFKSIYGDTIISSERILKSLAQFQLTLISDNSKYDSVKRKETEFTTQEKNGYKLFKMHCNTCHTEPLFTNLSFANNGLILDNSSKDLGRYVITKNPKDSFLFKIPSLRNLSYTFPYMHDGRFKNLNQVLKHYTEGIYFHSNLDSNLKKRITLNPNERIDLIAFLLTLNDKSFVKNPKFQFPR